MNKEENSFDRSNDEGHDASELHSFGGMMDESPENTDKTENEELADAIEELESSDVEDSIPEEKAESEDKPEEPAEEEAPEIKEEPAKKMEPVMTIDSVEEPAKADKKKGGAGWKVATILFALLAIAGCTAAGYFFFFDGTTNFLGRTIVSSQTKPILPNQPSEPAQPAEAQAGRYIYLDGHNLALKIPDTMENVSYEYRQFNEVQEGAYEGNFSTLYINASAKSLTNLNTKPLDVQLNIEKNFSILGAITISEHECKAIASAPELVMKTEDEKYIYYSHPQSYDYDDSVDQTLITKSVEAIAAWLTNKDNYVKVK